MLGLGSLLTKVAAAAVVPRIVKALSALGGPPEPVRAHPSQEAKDPGSESAPELEKSLYGRKPLLRHTRAYDAANKRWISRDPLGEGIDYNLYRYCGNSPVMLNDPEGLQPPEFDDGGYSGARDSFRNAVHNGVQTVETTGRRAGEFGIDMVGDPTDPTTWWTFFVSEEKLMWKVEQALLKWKKKLNRAKKCTDALNTVEGAQDQLESIQHAQNKLRKGKASGIVIDSIQKSTDRLRNSLKNRYQR